MSATSANLRDFGIDSTSTDKAVLITRPDMRIVKFSFLAPALVLAAGGIAYLLPLAIDRDLQLAGSLFIAGIGLVGAISILALYEGLANAVFTVTAEYVEEEYGIIHKRLRRIPLSYVRDVTCDQNFLQAMFGVSSVTVSPTNGHKVVFSNIKDGEKNREFIWRLVLRTSPINGQRTK